MSENSDITREEVQRVVGLAGACKEFSMIVPPYISYQNHVRVLRDIVINKSDFNYGGYVASHLICGTRAAAILATIPGFSPLIMVGDECPVLYGLFYGKVVVIDSNLEEGSIYCVYCENSKWDGVIPSVVSHIRLTNLHMGV